MIEKFDSKKHHALLTKLPFKYESSEIYLDFAGYVIERNSEKNVAVQDVLYPNDVPYLYLPNKKENWIHSIIQWAGKDQLEKIKLDFEVVKSFPSGKEYYYQTQDFIELSGSKWASFRKDTHHFMKNNNYKIFNEYDLPKVTFFLKNVWAKQQKEKTASFNESYNFFVFCLENQRKYGIKILYVEIDGSLVGLAMGSKFNNSDDKWLALHIKVNYKYRGLSRFLYHERAKLFAKFSEFTSGATCAGDEGIEEFKESLHPCRIEESYYIITGDKLNK